MKTLLQDLSSLRNCFLLLIGILIIAIIWNMTFKLKEQSNDIESIQKFTVKKGDTLWGIAKKHSAPGEDIRSLIYKIRKINNLKSVEIRPGQVIEIPVS